MKKLLFYAIIILFAASCSDDKNISRIIVDSGFSNYVNAFTSGVISSNSELKIVLLQPQENIKPGDRINENVFSFDPDIPGTAYWEDNQTIIFKPDEKLPSGEHFVVEFELGKILNVPEEYEVLKFDFITITQSIYVAYNGIKAISEDMIKQQLTGTFRINDFAENDKVEQCLKATQDDKDLTIIWEHTQGSNTHKYTITGISRLEKESFVNLSWSGDEIDADVEDKLEIRIPPIGEFSLMNIKTVLNPGIYFSIQFSDPLDTKQELAGLISLKSDVKLRFKIIGNEIKAYPLSKVQNNETIRINKSIISKTGNTLVSDYEKTVSFNFAKPMVKLIGEGVIIPSSSGEVSFPFKAINLKAVNLRILEIYEHNVNQFFQVNQFNGNSQLSRVGRLIYDGVVDLVSEEPIDYSVWNNFSIDINKLINPEPGALYRVMINFEQYQSLYPCADSLAQLKPLKRRELNFDEYFYFDDEMWYQGYSDYRDRENPCSPSYYKYYERSISANVFSSNFGIIAKEMQKNTYSVAITDLRDAEPESNVTIEAYNFQNVLVGKGKTGSSGVAEIKTKVKPYLLIASKGKDRGYLRIDRGSALSVSLYDVNGVDVKQGIKGFIYGERGVWRPGDTLFLSFMLEDKLNIIPESHPVILELYDPMGKLYDKKVSTKGIKGLYSFKFKTDKKSPTGRWQVKAIVGNSSFSKLLKIETIKPNRLRVNYDFDDLITSKKINTNLNAQWLYGAPGANLKINTEMNISTTKTVFEGYDGFSFDDITKRLGYQESVFVETHTNSEGDAMLHFDNEMPVSAPGMLKLSFNTKVYEQSGDFSQDFISKKYSPYRAYVGVKLEHGKNWLKALDTEDKHKIAIAAVDEFGKPLSRDVTVELYKMDRDWWWEGSYNDISGYISRYSYNKIKTEQFYVKFGKSFYELTFSEPGWGKYMLRIIDDKSGHSCVQTFYGRYSSWYDDDASGSSEAASAINIETSQDEYKVGEDIEITLPSGGIGKVYVTIEKGDQIIEQMWIDANDESTTFSFEATEEMAPNVYVCAMLIQPHAQKENSLPIRMFGIASVKVYNKKTILEPQINAPKSIQPESEYKITISEKSGKRMAYTLAVVDEGLLSLTRYKTPDPWNFFYAKEALKINTWDMYKYVLNSCTGKMLPLLAIGGDEALDFKDNAEANRFKPVVSYLGPFYLDKNDKHTHKLLMPNYIGSVRVMVVSGYKGAYGSADKEIQVKQPLMVLSTLPRVLGPSEKVKIPINVISMDDNIKNVNVKVSSNALINFTSETQKTVTFDKKGEQIVYFDCEIARKLGVAKFKVEVSSGKEKAYEELEISVRAPNPEITKSQDKSLKIGEKWEQNYTAFGITGSNNANIQLSSVPDLNIEKHLKYLLRYPHGCIEQTTSAVFPQLYLSNFVKLTDEQKEEIQKNIIAGLNKLKDFQLPNGAFSYWPGSNYISEWGTSYAGHFMLEAKNKGYDLPPGMLDNWIKYQKKTASTWDRLDYYYYGRYHGDLTQAYRLYTLALAGKGEMGAMNRLRNDSKLSNAGAWRLAAAYAIMGQDDAAKQLMQYDYHVEPYRATGYHYGSSLRDLAMVLETIHYSKNKNVNGFSILKDIAENLKYGWHSTQTRAYCLLAIAKYIGGDELNNTDLKAKVNINGKELIVESKMPVHNIEIDKQYLQKGSFSIENNSSKMLFVSFMQSGVPVEADYIAEEKGLSVTVAYQDLTGNSIDISSLKQGTDFKAIITVKHTGLRDNYMEMALNQVFPSGWQIVNTRVANDDNTDVVNYTYRDIRDDRAYTYFNLNRADKKTFEIRLNATFAGKFYLPAIFCAPMYDESIYSIKQGKWVEITIDK